MARKTKYVPAPWQEARDRDVVDRSRPPRKPLTERHLQYLQTIENKTVVLALGPPGSCKTALACQVAAKLYRAKQISRIILTRPLVECDEEMGFLPGTMLEKATPFIAPMLAFLREEFGKDLDAMLADGTVEVLPLAFMRGSTLGDAFVIADECQSATYRQLKMLLTRVGERCKLVLTGDVMQSDLDGPGEVRLVRIARQLKQAPHPDVGFALLTRDDVLRSGLARHMDERLVGERGTHGMHLAAPCLSLLTPPGRPVDVLVVGDLPAESLRPHRPCSAGTAAAYDPQVVVGAGSEATSYAAMLSCPLVQAEPLPTLPARVAAAASRGL